MLDIEGKKDILLSELSRIASYPLLPDEYRDFDICMFGGGKIGRFAFQGLDWYFGKSCREYGKCWRMTYQNDF